MRVWLIVDQRQCDQNQIIEHLVSRGLRERNIHIVYPLYRDTVVESINATHKFCVNTSRIAEHPFCTIFEQDVYFPAEDGIRRWLVGGRPRWGAMAATPSSQPFDVEADIYLAGCYNGSLETWRQMSEYGVYPAMPHARNVEGFHAYTIWADAYEKFLALPKTEHIDVAATDALDIAVAYPFCAIQSPGFSATQRRHIDKNVHFEKRDVYGL